MEFSLCYITCKDRHEAETLAHDTVLRRLAACANIVDGMTSVYEWKGELVEEKECILILKTRKEKEGALLEWIQTHHSYETPCVLFFPVAGGNPAYLSWLEAATRQD